MDSATDARTGATVRLGTDVAAEVGRALGMSGGAGARDAPLRLEPLVPGDSVYRVRAVVDGHPRSVVLKRHDPDAARRNRLVIERWLPALGLRGLAPPLLGAVAPGRGERVWHVYGQVGGAPLDPRGPIDGSAEAAVAQIALLHVSAAGHHLVPEVRREGEDLGMAYFAANVADALRLLDALRPSTVRPPPGRARVRDRLRRHLEALLDDAPRRARLMTAAGGAETLLHGDLWTSNIFVSRDGDGPRARLIDWDHAGAGPACYDLSCLLYRFPPVRRPAILEHYRAVAGSAGWSVPPAPEANLLFDTAECARYANRILWPAIALLEGDGAWGWDELAEIERWFRALEPVLQP